MITISLPSVENRSRDPKKRKRVNSKINNIILSSITI